MPFHLRCIMWLTTPTISAESLYRIFVELVGGPPIPVAHWLLLLRWPSPPASADDSSILCDSDGRRPSRYDRQRHPYTTFHTLWRLHRRTTASAGFLGKPSPETSALKFRSTRLLKHPPAPGCFQWARQLVIHPSHDEPVHVVYAA
ncbi:uncharacterized protein [Dermacentor albipictus]|uniref:uncharacterized protein isoform X3 n=1 Tax=Dermacentor albipictus TaxID=60249 RepID=UPI0038FCACCC